MRVASWLSELGALGEGLGTWLGPERLVWCGVYAMLEDSSITIAREMPEKQTRMTRLNERGGAILKLKTVTHSQLSLPR